MKRRKPVLKKYTCLPIEWTEANGVISQADAELWIDPIEIILKLGRKAAKNKTRQATALRGAIVVKATPS